MSNQRISTIIYVVLTSLVALTAIFYAFNGFSVWTETIPVDFGWLGLLFIFTNGFLTSIILDPNRLGLIERALLATGLGFGLTFTGMIIIGILSIFSFLVLLLSQIIIFLTLSALAIRRGFQLKRYDFSFKNKMETNPNLHTVLIAIIIILVIFALYKTLSLPAIEWDSLAYGVNYAKIIFQNADIPLIAGPSIGLEMSASYPPGIQLTAVFLYFFSGGVNDFFYRLLSPIFGIATILLTYKFAMSLNQNKSNLVFVISFLCIIPFFWEVFIQETYLMGLVFMLLLSAFFFYKAYDSKTPSDTKRCEIIGTLFCCFAALTSYTGLFSFGLLLLYAINKKMNLKRLMQLLFLGVVIVLPWYLRNFVLLGNPVYPFFGIGKYLDPLLRSSTTQHFQQYSLLPLYTVANLLCFLGIGVSIVAMIYLSFSKRRDFRFVLPYYILFVFLLIMVSHVIFPRYLIIALPAFIIICFTAIKSTPITKIVNLKKIGPWVLLPIIVVSSILMIPYIDSVKPSWQLDDDKSVYLSHVFEEADAWQWINENTPKNARIATFDIKEYYLSRDVVHLDGNESAALYQMQTINECTAYLIERNISYILSVPWASLGDIRMPPAYLWCPLTRHLGDETYLPTVFIGKNGTTIYHVGSLDENPIYQTLAEKNLTFPIKSITLNLEISNNTYPYSTQFYLPLPVDYRNGTMGAYVNSSRQLMIQLWSGLVPANEINKLSENREPIIQWVTQHNENSSIITPSFIWPVDKSGYFTFRVLSKETDLQSPLNITLHLKFYSFLELNKTALF